jgi:hypothetical protein
MIENFDLTYHVLLEISILLPWMGSFLVAIASGSRTEDLGFESRQGGRFFRSLTIAVPLSLCVFEKKML